MSTIYNFAWALKNVGHQQIWLSLILQLTHHRQNLLPSKLVRFFSFPQKWSMLVLPKLDTEGYIIQLMGFQKSETACKYSSCKNPLVSRFWIEPLASGVPWFTWRRHLILHPPVSRLPFLKTSVSLLCLAGLLRLCIAPLRTTPNCFLPIGKDLFQDWLQTDFPVEAS